MKAAMVNNVVTDHPSWEVKIDGGVFRCMKNGDSIWLLSCLPRGCGFRIDATLVHGDGAQPSFVIVDCDRLDGTDTFSENVRKLKRIARWSNGDIWDALATSIIRQVIRASHARKLYKITCETFGTSYDTDFGRFALFPTAETILALPDAELDRVGLGFKKSALRAAATAYLESAEAWSSLSPSELVAALTNIHRVGDWTARATVADVSNDFSVYPYGDLAVRTWAMKIDRSISWPNSDAEFAEVWQNRAAAQLSDWTLSTLAFGARHGQKLVSSGVGS